MMAAFLDFVNGSSYPDSIMAVIAKTFVFSMGEVTIHHNARYRTIEIYMERLKKFSDEEEWKSYVTPEIKRLFAEYQKSRELAGLGFLLTGRRS